MVGQVFLAYQKMCDGCPYRSMELFLKINHCNECEKKKKTDNKYKVLKYR